FSESIKPKNKSTGVGWDIFGTLDVSRAGSLSLPVVELQICLSVCIINRQKLLLTAMSELS
ncbi:MAG TPA: hypothetical protein VMT04_02420, partial [Terriglobales bacterium]|nr:hypothetical protein [Terriglobales bacterium]